MSAQLSVVIPCWNDAPALRALLGALRELRGIREIIVADATRGGECRAIAAAAGAKIAHCPQPNRGAQMNAGARLATGDARLCQHADTDITQLHINALHAAMCDASTIGGAFHRRYDGRHAGLGWMQHVTRVWNEHGGTLYGDQSIFIRRAAFEQLGGFAEIPLMEDVEFSRRLRRAGRTVVLDPPIATSPRHHARRGAWRTTARNATMLALFRLGICPHRLHAWYYRGFADSASPPAPAPATTEP